MQADEWLLPCVGWLIALVTLLWGCWTVFELIKFLPR
jgi:hypothetical protein